MAEKSAIEWLRDPFLDRAGATWNRWVGCERQSAACVNCYIVRQPPLRMRRLRFDSVAVGGRTDIVFADEKTTLFPLRKKTPLMIFPNSLSDLWDGRVNINRVAETFAVMLLASRHIFITTTKRDRRQRNWLRSHRFRLLVAAAIVDVLVLARKHGVHVPQTDIDAAFEHLKSSGPGQSMRPLPNQWVGVTLEGNETAGRARNLYETPAAVRWLSCEPITDPELDLNEALTWPCDNCDGEGIVSIGFDGASASIDYCDGNSDGDGCDHGFIHFSPDWVVFGGESGPAAKATEADIAAGIEAPGLRPLDLDHLDLLIEQAEDRGARVFVKQLGDPWAEQVGANAKAGRDPSEWPENLRIREYPDALAHRALRYDPDNALARKDLTD